MNSKNFEVLSGLIVKLYSAEFIHPGEILFDELEDDKSVRQLAEEAGVSPTAIQNVRSGKSEDMRLKNFVSVVQALGYNTVLEKDGQRIPFAPTF